MSNPVLLAVRRAIGKRASKATFTTAVAYININNDAAEVTATKSYPSPADVQGTVLQRPQ